MKDFINGDFVFKSEQGLNDVWLEINFDDLAFEIAIVKHILFHLGRQYEPFDSLNPDIHC